MVTKWEVLEELPLPILKRIAQEMDIEVDTGLAGFLGKSFVGQGPWHRCDARVGLPQVACDPGATPEV